jgi:hypothetical protein
MNKNQENLVDTFGSVFTELFNNVPEGTLFATWLQFENPEPELVYCLPEEYSITPREVRSVNGVRKGLHIQVDDIVQAIDGVLPFTYGSFTNAFYK